MFVLLTKPWNFQVKDCLKQNEELRGLLDKLLADQANMLHIKTEDVHLAMEKEKSDRDMSSTEAYVSLKVMAKIVLSYI